MGAVGVRPARFTFSWLQARQTHLGAARHDDLDRLADAGFRSAPLDWFYDIQVVQRQHMSRFVLSGLDLAVHTDEGLVRGAASLSLVFWHVGYFCLRLTLEGPSEESTVTAVQVQALHAAEHEGESPGESPLTLTGEVAGRPVRIAGNVRRVFDWFGAYVHEVLAGRPASAGDLAEWSASFDAGLARRTELVAAGELTTLYPATFGTHAELCWDDDLAVPVDPDQWVPELLAEVRRGERHGEDVDRTSDTRWWYLSEFQSLLISSGTATIHPDVRVADTDRVQLIEYLALRRGALSAVQRQTQLAAAERRPVARREVAEWTWFVNAVTDDYVVGGWSASMLEQVKRVLRESSHLRDVVDLEGQVRRNVDAFQARLDAESDRTGIMIAVFFGIGAATSLFPLAQAVYSNASGVSPEDFASFPATHYLPYVAMSALLLIVVGGIALTMLLRGRYLRPPPRGRLRRHAARTRRTYVPWEA